MVRAENFPVRNTGKVCMNLEAGQLYALQRHTSGFEM